MKPTTISKTCNDLDSYLEEIIIQSKIEFPDCNTKSDQETIQMFRDIWIKGVLWGKENF